MSPAPRSAPDEVTGFTWLTADERLRAWVSEATWSTATAGGRFEGTPQSGAGHWELEVPLVLGKPPEGMDLPTWIQAMARSPGAHLVLLYRAGAAAMGTYVDDEQTSAKTLRRYVVRGKGRAQPSYLKTKGKSRYGSRLRLRNAIALRDEVVQRMIALSQTEPAWKRIFTAVPVRTWPELFEGPEQPPFTQRDERLLRVPMDVPRPNQDVLARVRGFLGRGRLRIWREP